MIITIDGYNIPSTIKYNQSLSLEAIDEITIETSALVPTIFFYGVASETVQITCSVDGNPSSIVSDTTSGLTSSGFITWDTVGSEVVFTLSSPVDLTINSISLIFCDDIDLQQKEYNIVSDKFRLKGVKPNHLVTCQEVTNEFIRNLGLNADDEFYTIDDVFHITEFRDAACYSVISKIYFSCSDSVNDIYWEKSKYWQALADSAFASGKFKLDTDSNNVEDDDRKTFNTMYMRK